ncbi:deoxyribose-phosphate aldolase [Brachybacterium sacelli]|uniref:Deoxyribose-phosphate aldolase n=1 Tax=Brachybacterium sacelli TaxID=173364 RepID=A0ABS4X4W7_9MICO|nr:deoxyribose-phosphate aldolase [Brachybacterium sacelli]MBP2383503.1 deoxyribose-phosphate aldolase [Brachybacterium sacelli]
MTTSDRAQFAALIDHTLLKPEATRDDVTAQLREAEELGTYSVCISPSMLPVRTSVKVATVCGFPSGQHAPAIKAAEAADSVAKGADEVDMVLNVGLARAGEYAAVEDEIRAVRETAPSPVVLKVIIESAALTDEQIVAVCEAAERAGADFVKTSTGFHPDGGATEHAVQLMRRTVGDRLGVKASGGIRTREAAEAMVAAGASRLGLSSSRAILEGGTGTGY